MLNEREDGLLRAYGAHQEKIKRLTAENEKLRERVHTLEKETHSLNRKLANLMLDLRHVVGCLERAKKRDDHNSRVLLSCGKL